jgi:hypothetical protein
VYELPSWRTDPVGWSAGAGPLSDVTSLHAFSPTGRCIAFSTAAANALDPPVAGSSLVVHDRVTLTNRRVSDFLSGRFARGGADWIGAAAGALIESDLNFLPDIYVALDAAPECTLSGTSTLGSPPALVAGGPGLGSITETALSPRAVATTAERMLVLSEGLRLVDRSSGRQLLVHLSSSPTVEPIKVDDLRSPCAIAARSDGSFVIGDAASGALFTMDTSGNVARMTNIVGPCTIAVDPNDDTIVAHTDPAISPYPIVERVTSAGVRTLLAGGGNGPSDVTPAIGSRIDPTDLAIAPDGSVTLIDRYGVPAVRRIAGADLERIAGGNQGIDPGNDIPATDAVIDPEGIAWTPTGLLIAEYSRVRRVDNGGMIRGYTGTDPQTVDTDGAAPHATAFRELLDVTLGPDGVPLVVEEHTSTVRRLGGVVTTVAGHRNIGGTAPPPSPIAGDGDLASRASFRALDQVLRDGSRIVIHDGFRMRAIEPNGRVVELFRPSTARNDPAAPAVDGQGTIAYVDDHRIWKRGGDGVPTPIVGNGQSGGVTVDGPALDTALGKVRSLAFDAQGRLLFSDDSRIFRVELDGTLRVIAGGGVLTTDGVPATSRGLTRPAELAVESSGAILFAESGRLRRLTPFGDVWALLTVVPTNVTTFAPAPDGTIWFSNGARVFSRAPNGTITWVAGREGISGTDRAEQTSLGRALMPITDVLVMPDGRVQVATGATIQTVASAAPAASTFTADARFDPTLIPLLESAADFWGVPLEDLPRAGMNFLAWIIAVNPGLEPLMMTPSDNFGSTHLVTTYSPTEVVDAQRIAGFIGADLDDAHRQAALVMVFVQHLLGA